MNSARGILISIGFLTTANAALGDLAHKQQALEAISAFADKYCEVVTQEGSSTDVSAKIDAEASWLAKYLAKIGFETAGQYITDHYKGPNRKAIPELNAECRYAIWADLNELLKDEAQPSPPAKTPIKVCFGEGGGSNCLGAGIIELDCCEYHRWTKDGNGKIEVKLANVYCPGQPVNRVSVVRYHHKSGGPCGWEGWIITCP